jgi:hypothetical protein
MRRLTAHQVLQPVFVLTAFEPLLARSVKVGAVHSPDVIPDRTPKKKEPTEK